ncbi:MAG: DUF1697 domain-containing protein [Caldilineales bacterium]
MKTWIAMLRGINVSGQKKIKMADLRAMFEAADFSNVQSYVQSGNVVFDAGSQDAATLTVAIEAAIIAAFGFEVSVFLRDADDFRRIIEGNPFLARGNVDPKRLYVTFLNSVPSEGLVNSTEVPAGSADEFAVLGDAVYLHCPDGYGTTRLSNTFFERKLAMPATTRNWNTVNALAEMAARD